MTLAAGIAIRIAGSEPVPADVLTHANLERTYGVPFGESSPTSGQSSSGVRS